MKNLKFLFATVLTVFMSVGVFAQIDPFLTNSSGDVYLPSEKLLVGGQPLYCPSNINADFRVLESALIGKSSGAPSSNSFYNSSRGLYIGNAGAILDKNSGYFNIVGSPRISFLIKDNAIMKEAMIVNKNGQVGIGVDNGSFDNRCAVGFDLSVGGKMIAEEVKVALQGTIEEWPDYVFTPEYQLTPLAELETQIEELGHLPNIPSAEEVKENGFFLGEMDAMLLEKIEELTLHLIDLNKEVQAVKAENAQLKASK